MPNYILKVEEITAKGNENYPDTVNIFEFRGGSEAIASACDFVKSEITKTSKGKKNA
jgi:hypothetical protein